MFKKIAAAAALAFVASSAFAGPTAFYAGVDAGLTSWDYNNASSKVSVGGFVGYGFNQYIAAELGYRQLGDFNGFKISQTHISAVGSYPLNNRLDIFGRLGYTSLSVSGCYNYGNGYTYCGGDIGTGTVIGAGVAYSFAPNIVGRVEVQKPATDVTNVGVGVVFKF
jgi:hypothetical protein